VQKEIVSLSGVIGYNAQASLEFKVGEDAQNILNGFSTRESVIFAGIYTADRVPLAEYRRSKDSTQKFIPKLPLREFSHIDEFLHVSQPVSLDGRLLGFVYIRDDMREIHTLRLQTFGMVLLFLLAALFVSYLLLIKLQALISGPIMNLAETARQVSEEKNYSLRAVQETQDEVGFLIESFNSMLDQIELRDEDLVRSNKELEQFAYVASHDLQEPLRMISSYLQLLHRRYQGKLDADADEFIGFAVDGAKRMQVLIQDLLAFSRVGTRKIELQQVKVGKILEEVKTTLNPLIKDTKASIHVGDLPEILGEPNLLNQLFQNLLTNAIKYHGEKDPEIFILAAKGDHEWIFSVRDNGIGIDLEFAEKIFVIFQRLHTKEEYPGTGIGLAICKKIVERLHGKIWFESVKGESTTFYVSFPLREETHPVSAWDAYQEVRGHGTT
jgi:signal transduction histidine kinase